jgi:hypothetical protein
MRGSGQGMSVRAAIGAASVALLLDGCARPQPAQPGPVALSKPISATGGEILPKQKLVFFDSDAFDRQLAAMMKDRTTEVHVAFAGPTSINALPPRMNAWLNEVQKSDGQVTAVDPSAPPGGNGTRGFGIDLVFDLIDFLTGVENRQAEAERLAQAQAYDARVLYDSATGNAREVVFVRRGQNSS